VASYKIVLPNDERFDSVTSSKMMTGPGPGFDRWTMKATNNPFDFAQQVGAIILTQIADYQYSSDVEEKAYRVLSKLTGTPIVPGKIAVEYVYAPPPRQTQAAPPFWVLFSDNGQDDGPKGPPRSDPIPNMDFTPFLDGAQQLLHTEYFTTLMNTQFVGYLSSQINDNKLTVFIQAATRYRLIATLIARRSSYSDSAESCSVFNTSGWFDTGDVLNGIQKTIASMPKSIAYGDWWDQLQTRLAATMRSGLMDTYHRAQMSDPQRSFPAIDDTLRQLATVSKLQGLSIR
jgi:hypothetical protein